MAVTGMRLRDFQVLTFDCYGTLIDWESGMYAAMAPLVAAAARPPTRAGLLAQFALRESAVQSADPALRYPQVPARVHEGLARDLGVSLPDSAHRAFGQSIPDWPAFPDTVGALQYLKRHYRLVVLSNVDRESFAASNARLGVTFEAVCTAQDIGSYKPDPRNFAYLIEAVRRLGAEPRHILHTAQSLYHDHAPAQAAGLKSAWIDRGHGSPASGATRRPEQMPHFDFRFETLGALAAAHAAEGS